jgi:hypothetical protein
MGKQIISHGTHNILLIERLIMKATLNKIRKEDIIVQFL